MVNVLVPTEEVFKSYNGLHCHKLWKQVGPDWICPSCRRTKFQILRWTTRFPGKSNSFEDWVAILHRHHDHSIELSISCVRFQETIICDQCNSADGVAKRKLKLPSHFSFSPSEIAQFVKPTHHGEHSIDLIIAKSIFEKQFSNKFW